MLDSIQNIVLSKYNDGINLPDDLEVSTLRVFPKCDNTHNCFRTILGGYEILEWVFIHVALLTLA